MQSPLQIKRSVSTELEIEDRLSFVEDCILHYVKKRTPNLRPIGGVDPMVKTAGIIEFRAGKIYKVDNVSGHFKPSAQSLQNAQPLFKQKFSPNSFADDFQGFVPFSN